jgi:serine-type D-Ala-D-Ala endopeptidase (penicillin-binding protein 7)
VLLDSLGTRTPLGDAGRIGRWLRTGQGGSVAVAARDYERQRQRDYASGLPVATKEAQWTAK